MNSVVFSLIVYVTSAYTGSIAHIDDYQTLQQCETVGKQILEMRSANKYVCVEKQVKTKKMKCNINNDFSYNNPNSYNLYHYPYPTSITCEVE